MPVKTPVTILDLPIELYPLIASFLVPDWQDITKQLHVQAASAKKLGDSPSLDALKVTTFGLAVLPSLQALSSFNRTCKNIYDATAATLWHDVTWRVDYPWEGLKPELAGLIDTVWLVSEGEALERNPCDDMPLLKALRKGKKATAESKAPTALDAPDLAVAVAKRFPRARIAAMHLAYGDMTAVINASVVDRLCIIIPDKRKDAWTTWTCLANIPFMIETLRFRVASEQVKVPAWAASYHIVEFKIQYRQLQTRLALPDIMALPIENLPDSALTITWGCKDERELTTAMRDIIKQVKLFPRPKPLLQWRVLSLRVALTLPPFKGEPALPGTTANELQQASAAWVYEVLPRCNIHFAFYDKRSGASLGQINWFKPRS